MLEMFFQMGLGRRGPQYEEPKKYYKLKKVLYGLKQAPRAWFEIEL